MLVHISRFLDVAGECLQDRGRLHTCTEHVVDEADVHFIVDKLATVEYKPIPFVPFLCVIGNPIKVDGAFVHDLVG
jgi:hypothetical protein